ncbi:uncharacterized protein LOC581833 [Strongylocentrotus purpuratus]|uniref:Uncharacterized protein n=1 Tax=Strongylocentrotus purpuratus TaxID=7668 RepID=A0A7M7PDC6_STRPU|nr:uncharacterized protein LOC581833 [Strongylocentrotus purpuratus]
MDVNLGCCGLVLAFLCIFFGMTEVGLWAACYFKCPDGKLIEFNYFAAVWTGVLAFTVGFMIIVLFCVKFKSLGTFIIILTFLLVPCEIICACIYAYRAYLSRPMEDDVITGNVGVDYFSVFFFSAMSIGGVFLFLITITWNCYYFCIATPAEDYEEEVKEDLEEEDERQQNLRTVQDSVFVNNPVVDDESRPNQTRPLQFDQEPNQVRFPHSVQNGHPQGRPSRQSNGYLVPNSDNRRDKRRDNRQDNRRDNRRDNRNVSYDQSLLVRNDYPYPPALERGPVPEDLNRRNRQQSSMPRPHLGANHQSYIPHESRRGQVNRGYEADELGQPIDRAYNLRSYIYDGVQGDPMDQPVYSGGQPLYSEQPRRSPNQNPSSSADHGRNHPESRRHVNRPPNYSTQLNSREPAANPQPRDEDRSFIYRPTPDNFRGKPPQPEYMSQQQQQTAPNNSYPLQVSAQHPGPAQSAPNTRGPGPTNTYF